MQARADPDARALFALDVCVDDATFISRVAERGVVLAFQLLRFDVVAFEAPAPTGLSCLLEAAPAALWADLERDPLTALVLLALEREQQRAELAAFACVPLTLDGAFAGGRVREWTRVTGVWQWTDRRDEAVGSVSATVSLSCLGHGLAVLAPGGSRILQATAALGESSVERESESESESESPRAEADEAAKQNENEERDAAQGKNECPPEPSSAERPPVAQLSVGVQCVLESEELPGGSSRPAPLQSPS
ncbi:hypothetical protein P43SY_007649 [Pythium insidiosum]|uniref:Uncharacterized protein n=1 Tax=Pythium insidiosum TaxID=114742 RepID=A0AAD5Q8H7_PYTIN|nr:hypothetical protein P43SY_007649 [Pythium insidiosum]